MTKPREHLSTLTCDDRKSLCVRGFGGPDTVKRVQRSRQLSECLGGHIDPTTHIPRTHPSGDVVVGDGVSV